MNVTQLDFRVHRFAPPSRRHGVPKGWYWLAALMISLGLWIGCVAAVVAVLS